MEIAIAMIAGMAVMMGAMLFGGHAMHKKHKPHKEPPAVEQHGPAAAPSPDTTGALPPETHTH